jgi:hypothetical protein
MASSAPESETTTVSTRPKVVYVMGAGRSGSTILGVALGNCVDVFDAGELDAWLRRSGIPNFAGAERMRFWGAVRREVPEGDSLFGDLAWRYLEHSLALFRITAWSKRRQLRRRYRKITESLYHAIAHNSGAVHVIDTSHYPLRARELQRLSGIDLYIVYLVRDPHSVVESFNRKDGAQNWKSPVATNAYLWLTHALSVSVFLRHRRDRRLFLRHEDFIANPERVLTRVQECIDTAPGLPDLRSLTTGIPFQGNRLLRSEVLALRRGVGPPPRRLAITTLLQLPWETVLSLLRPSAADLKA